MAYHKKAHLHEPLPEGNFIRCLELQPGADNDPLTAAIRVVRLEDAQTSPTYEAMSYVWGSPALDHDIVCDGRVHRITANLGDALRQVRLREKPRVLWADQLCIDQDNLKEKARQLNLMGRIYAASSCTLVCLGHNDSRHAPLANGILDDAYSFIQDTFRHIDIAPDSFPILDDSNRLFSDDRWASLGVLLQQPWFSRGWVAQEVALGPDAKILWAGIEIEWLQLLEVYQWLAFKAPRLHVRFPDVRMPSLFMGAFSYHRYEHAIALLPHVDPPEEQRDDILVILSAATELNLSDARDRIFAFLGFRTLLLSEALLATYPVDYTKTPLQTYHDFAMEYLRATSDLDILSYVQNNETALDDKHSSWFPRWNEPHSKIKCYRGGWSRIRPELKSLRISVDSDNQVIGVKGVIFDSVTFCSQVLDSQSTKVEDIASIWQAITASNPADQQIYAPRTIKAFTQTLTQTFTFGGNGKWEDYETAYAQRLEDSTTSNSTTANRGGRNDTLVPDIDYFHHRLLSNSANGRKFVTLSHGHFGNAPSTTKPGDMCCILYGAKTPFVVRKTARQGFYKLVGAVYVPSAGVKPETSEEYFRRLGFMFDGRCEDWKARAYEETEIFLC